MSEVLGGVDLKDSLTKKIGGLPGAVWVGIGLGGYYLFTKFRGGLNTPTTSTSVTDTPGASHVTASSVPMSADTGTNAFWASTAANHLMNTSSYSALDIQNALANYQSGNGLTGTQQTIIDSVLHSFGTPPQGVQPIYTAADPVLPPTVVDTTNYTNTPTPFVPQIPNLYTPYTIPYVAPYVAAASNQGAIQTPILTPAPAPIQVKPNRRVE